MGPQKSSLLENLVQRLLAGGTPPSCWLRLTWSPGDTSQCTFSRQLTAGSALGSVPVLKTPVRPFSVSGKDEGGHEPWKAGGTCPACGMWVSPCRGFWSLLADPPFRPCHVAYRQALPRTKGSQTCRPPTELSQHGQHHCTGQHLVERGFCPLGRTQESSRGTDSPSPPTGVSQQRLGSIGPAGSLALSKASRGVAQLPSCH